jgi:cytidylate kinase
MSVIALSCEIGTSGREIAIALARRLDLDLADELLLEERIACRLARASDAAGRGVGPAASLYRCLNLSDRTLARYASDEIEELAAYGRIVLRGWGAPVLLMNKPHVMRVRLSAPRSARLRALSIRSPGLGESALRALIELSDRSPAANMESVFGPVWRSENIYQLRIDTQTRSPQEIVEEIEAVICANPVLQLGLGASGETQKNPKIV